MKLQSINPSNYEILGEVEVTTENEIKAVVANAHKAKTEWKNIGVKERIKHLTRLYEHLEKHKVEIAKHDSQDMGFPITQCRNFNLGDGFSYFKWNLDNAEKCLSPQTTFEDETQVHQVYFEPYGVAAVIQPWNFPFCQWSWGSVAALLAGNVVIYKPSEEVLYTSKYLENLINECDLPKGVLQFVYGDGKTGDYLVHQNIDLISFTGSVNTGQYLYKVAAEKFIPILLELGGSAPGVIFEDADIDETVEGVFWQRFANCGQTCDGLKRLIVHENIFQTVVGKLASKLKDSKLGDPMQEDTVFGPLVAKRQVDVLKIQLEDALGKGAKAVVGGTSPTNQTGAYFEPTLLTNVTTDMKVWQEEVFGPALPVMSFKTEAEAINLANNTEYGLGSYMYTKDLERAQRVASQLEAGMISVNGLNYVLPQNPFGGYKKSGIGREHGHFGFEDLTQVKLIALPK